MPTTIIAGNWKMFTTIEEAGTLLSGMRDALEAVGGVEKVICPPFISLDAIGAMLQGSSVALGAQNMHPEAQGAFTGEVSPAMLAGLCQYVILGHSERRQLFGETDEFVNLKVKAAIAAGLRPILCVGEHLRQREDGNAESVVEAQLRQGLSGIDSPGGLVVAYEPVWAIGTGRAATPDVAQSMMAHVRSVLSSLFPSRAEDISLLYGGSVNPANAADYMRQPDVNGALVGGASLNAESFTQIVQTAAQANP